MNPKIKLRRSTSTAGKKIDAGEPMFDLTSGKLYISKADNKTIGTDAEVVEIGGGGGVPDNIECVSVTTTPSGSGTKSGKIVLNNALSTPTITLDGKNGKIMLNGGEVVSFPQSITTLFSSGDQISTFLNQWEQKSFQKVGKVVSSTPFITLINGYSAYQNSVLILEQFYFSDTVDFKSHYVQRLTLTNATNTARADNLRTVVFIRKAVLEPLATNVGWSNIAWEVESDPYFGKYDYSHQLPSSSASDFDNIKTAGTYFYDGTMSFGVNASGGVQTHYYPTIILEVFNLYSAQNSATIVAQKLTLIPSNAQPVIYMRKWLASGSGQSTYWYKV